MKLNLVSADWKEKIFMSLVLTSEHFCPDRG